MEKLGPVFNQLDWQGACSDDSVGSLISYIDSIKSSDEPHWVEVGSFSADTGEYTDYFMLVNRECLESEAADYDVFFTAERGLYRIRDMYTDSIIAVVNGSGDQFVVHLDAGEGKLFRLEPRLFGSRVIQVPQDSSCIQCAIDGAQNGDTVLVAPGTYFPRESINFRGKGIVVASYYIIFGEASYISDTEINACSTSSDTASVVCFVSGEDSSSVIAGFFLRGGQGTLGGGGDNRYGGGVYCYASSPIIRNNIISGSFAYGSGPGYGGGICCRANDCAPTISSNLIRLNGSNWGGGIYCDNSSPEIVNNVIEENTASVHIFVGGYGGGISCEASTPLIINNTIDYNYAENQGAGISILGSTVYLINNIISNCRSKEGIHVGDMNPNFDTVYISYCDFWANEGGNFGGYEIPGLGDTSWGENRNGTPCDSFYNILEDPNFVDGYHLDDSSACIDAGDNDAPALPATDFDGNPRVVDGNGDDSSFVDMGAYEYQPAGGGGPAKIVAGGDREDSETGSSSGIPDEFLLSQNYPNPFNPTTVMEFEIAQPAKVSLKIYNILGQLVRVLVDEEKTAGTYTVYWDGNDKNGQSVSSGIYFCKLDAGNFSEVKKMVLIK